jgi:serine protease Do
MDKTGLKGFRPPALSLIVVLSLAPAALAQAPVRRVPTLDELSSSFQALSISVTPACVQITTVGFGTLEASSPTMATLLGRQRTSGSGFIVDPAGYIITNAHVVRGARRIQVVLSIPADPSAVAKSIVKPPGKTVEAEVVGSDLETDIAVLKVVNPTGTKLPALPLADSDSLEQGQIVFAFGSPYGLPNSVSIGIVSAVARQRTADDPMVYIQTDAAINPGNSGGPLVDTKGRVVGVNTFVVSEGGGNEGIGFAAPSNIVRHVFDQIRQQGRVRRGVIGVNAQTITPVLAAGLKLPQAWGVIVADVIPESPAALSGIRPGDVILTLDGKVMENGRQFDVNLYRRSPGDTVRLETLRDGEKQIVLVAVGERAEDPARFIDMVNPDRSLIPRLGVLGMEIDPAMMTALAGPRRGGAVLVAARAADAASSDSGLLPGDIILALNGASIGGLADLRREVDALKPGAACVLQVQRQGRLTYVGFEID